MKATELIKQLQDIIDKEQKDFEVIVSCDDYFNEVLVSNDDILLI